MLKIKLSGVFLLLLCIALVPMGVFAQDEVQSGDVAITSGGRDYASYLAAPGSGGPYPAIVLIHSFRGLEEGYRTMVDELAGQGFVVLAVGWQTFEQSPDDATVKQLIEDSVAFLKERED